MVIDRPRSDHVHSELAAGLSRLEVQIIHDFHVIGNKSDRAKDNVASRPRSWSCLSFVLTSGSSQGVCGFPLRLCQTRLQGRPSRQVETFRQAVSICATYGQRSAIAIGMLCAVKRSRA